MLHNGQRPYGQLHRDTCQADGPCEGWETASARPDKNEVHGDGLDGVAPAMGVLDAMNGCIVVGV